MYWEWNTIFWPVFYDKTNLQCKWKSCLIHLKVILLCALPECVRCNKKHHAILQVGQSLIIHFHTQVSNFKGFHQVFHLNSFKDKVDILNSNSKDILNNSNLNQAKLFSIYFFKWIALNYPVIFFYISLIQLVQIREMT